MTIGRTSLVALLVGACLLAPAPTAAAPSDVPSRPDPFAGVLDASRWASLRGDSLARDLMVRATRLWRSTLDSTTAFEAIAEFASPCAGIRGRTESTPFRVRVAHAGDGRISADIQDVGAPGIGHLRWDRTSYVEWNDFTHEGVRLPHPSLAGEVFLGSGIGFVCAMAQGMELSRSSLDPPVDIVLERGGEQDFLRDGRTRHCIGVRARFPAPTKDSQVYWIEPATAILWQVDFPPTAWAPLGSCSRWDRVRIGPVPPDSVFAASLPAGVALVSSADENRPHLPLIGAGPRPHIGPDSTVTFRWRGPAKSVSVAGRFNCWDPAADPLTLGPDGTWSHTCKVHAMGCDYLFVIDGTSWRLDPAAGCRKSPTASWVSTVFPDPPGH